MTVFLSCLIELSSIIMLHWEQTLPMRYLLCLLPLKNKIWFSSAQNPTVGTAEGTTMTQAAKMLTGQPC